MRARSCPTFQTRTNHCPLAACRPACPLTNDTQQNQIIPPLDAGIAAAIDANLPLWDLSAVDLAAARADGRLSDPLEEVADAYFSRLGARLRFQSAADNAAAAPVVYTPLVREGCWWFRGFKFGSLGVSNRGPDGSRGGCVAWLFGSLFLTILCHAMPLQTITVLPKRSTASASTPSSARSRRLDCRRPS